MECLNLKRNLATCTCTYEPCTRKGRCCECLAYHRASGELPGCLFTKEAEATYDRSARKFKTSVK
jgi:hypothetical protein